MGIKLILAHETEYDVTQAGRVVVVCCLLFYFILSRLLYLAFSANLGLLCMPHPGMGPLCSENIAHISSR